MTRAALFRLLLLSAAGCATRGPPPGYVAIHRWQVKPGCEDVVREAWRAEAARYRDRYGSCGARLHRAGDGTLVATAFWRTRADADRAPRPIDAPGAEAALNRCLVAEVESLQLETLEDLSDLRCEP